MSDMLFDEEPLLVPRKLAKTLGINEAIILQQIHYWIRKKLHYNDGKYWTYNTYEDWANQFNHLSPRAIRRYIGKLEEMGILESNQYNKKKYDQTKWYTINYKTLNSYNQDGQNDVDKLDTSYLPKMDTSEVQQVDTSINTKTTTKNISNRESIFREEVKQHLTDYSLSMINDFCDYWTEPNASRKKMKYELEKTFDIKRRLKTWHKNSKKFGADDRTGVVEI